jgi:kynurenine formamidase
LTAKIKINDKMVAVDLSKPLDISIPLRGDVSNVNAWYVEHPKITPHTSGDFVGKVTLGASTNFNDIWFNPHAHGTHTECVGHITKEFYAVNHHLKQFFYTAQLITLSPETYDGDRVITQEQLEKALGGQAHQALVIRTLPNALDKLGKQYSNTNPPYLQEAAAKYMVSLGIDHLLIDLPSVDRERDNGQLLAHRAFWNTGGEIRFHATITELVYVPNSIEDGEYVLNLQVAPFENDASPSRPVLYKIKTV